ncbi:hypothetical protein O1L55_05210 [Streptomyces albulus]|nr:hypothetical protein [Streptomyces noursei]
MLLSLVPLTVAAATAYSLRPRAEAGAVDTEPAPITKAPPASRGASP